MKTLIIAEKPSLAKEIQNMLSASFGQHWQRKDGYSESERYLISSFFGHLLEALNPDDYDEKMKEWKLEHLPILPGELKYKYKSGVQKQGKMLAALSKHCDTVVNACDPDREGEGIFRNWFNAEKLEKKILRLWAPSLALKDLTKSWEKMKSGVEYENLAQAQKMRATSDWLVGMNATRAYTVAGKTLLPIGRVKTATLAIVVKRDGEVENFKESFSYSLCGRWNGIEFTYADADGNRKFSNRAIVEQVQGQIDKIFRLKEARTEQAKENPPKTFSMPDLQKEANVRFGWGLDKTLSLTQSLYEAKIVTYPRTDSPYLPESDKSKYFALVNSLSTAQQKALVRSENESIPCIKNTDASHTAIIPTGENAARLTGDEATLYELIKGRFITAFLRPRIYEKTFLSITDKKFVFETTVEKTLDAGFAAQRLKEEEKEEDVAVVLDTFNIEALKSDKGSLLFPVYIKDIKAKKPIYYTPATLLTAMINVGRTVNDADMKEILKEVEGLGTAATRDKFPKELMANGYIEQKGKYLISTEKGRQLIQWVHEKLKSPELTAQWEMKLREVEDGKYSPVAYRKELDEFVREIVKVNISRGEELKVAVDTAAELCKCQCGGVVRGHKWGCKCDGCGRSVSDSVSKKKISDREIKALFETGSTGVIDGFEKKDGSAKFSAKLIFNDEKQLRFSFDLGVGISCPKCKNEIEVFSRGYRCKNKECGFILWDQFAGKALTDTQMKVLLTKGKTGVLKGFISKKNGKPYNAALVMRDGGKIEMDFESKK